MPCCRKSALSPNASSLSGAASNQDDTPTYEDYMRFANALAVTLRKPEDCEFCEEILRNCTRIYDSGIPEARQCIITYLSYFLKVLHKTTCTQPLEVYEQWYKDNDLVQKLKTKRLWLEENKSFFLMEKTACGGILFYTAIATDPSAGWDEGGLSKL